MALICTRTSRRWHHKAILATSSGTSAIAPNVYLLDRLCRSEDGRGLMSNLDADLNFDHGVHFPCLLARALLSGHDGMSEQRRCHNARWMIVA